MPYPGKRLEKVMASKNPINIDDDLFAAEEVPVTAPDLEDVLFYTYKKIMELMTNSSMNMIKKLTIKDQLMHKMAA